MPMMDVLRGLGRPRSPSAGPGRRGAFERDPRLRARRHELIASFADLVADEAAKLYGEDAWPADRARVQGLVYVAGFAELVACWLTGEVDLSADELASTASDLFVSLSRRP